MLRIYIDADACPVKEEVYKVARRYALRVMLVANKPLRHPPASGIELVLVDHHSDAADQWIIAHCGGDDIVITADIPLAAQCIGRGARVITPGGKIFNENNIGAALATRDLLSDLRSAGAITAGPPSFQPSDRSRFLQSLDRIIQEIRRK